MRRRCNDKLELLISYVRIRRTCPSLSIGKLLKQLHNSKVRSDFQKDGSADLQTVFGYAYIDGITKTAKPICKLNKALHTKHEDKMPSSRENKETSISNMHLAMNRSSNANGITPNAHTQMLHGLTQLDESTRHGENNTTQIKQGAQV